MLQARVVATYRQLHQFMNQTRNLSRDKRSSLSRSGVSESYVILTPEVSEVEDEAEEEEDHEGFCLSEDHRRC